MSYSLDDEINKAKEREWEARGKAQALAAAISDVRAEAHELAQRMADLSAQKLDAVLAADRRLEEVRVLERLKEGRL